MLVDIKKFLFVGANSVKKSFFETAQKKGIVHFIDVSKEKTRDVPEELQHISNAIKILRGLPLTEQMPLEDYSQAGRISMEIIDLKHRIEKFDEEQRSLRLEIARIDPFGEFSFEDIKYIESEGARVVQFFCAKENLYGHDLEIPENVLYVTSDNALDYFIAVNHVPMQYEKMIEMKIDQPLSKVKTRLVHVKKEVHELEHKLNSMAKYSKFLHHSLVYNMNDYNLHTAESYAQLEVEDTLFAVEGWVPATKVDELWELVRQKSVHYEEIAIEEGDGVPTYLENTGLNRMGEDLIKVYDTPSIEDKDPSLWVLFSFSIFFGLIVGDGGYGLVFLLAAIFMRFKIKNIKPLGKRLLNTFTILSLSIITWGLLTTSFFGMSFELNSPIQKVSLVKYLVTKRVAHHQKQQDATYKNWEANYPKIKGLTDPEEIINATIADKKGSVQSQIYKVFSDNVMIEIALLIGVIHISLSLLRYADRNWGGIGWVIFIFGAYIYVPLYLKTTSMFYYLSGFNEATVGPNGIYLMEIGFASAVILSIIQNGWKGLLEIMAVIQLFADILSYLRLYALGLAGAIIGQTVNGLASSLNIVLFVIVIILGHVINMVLSIGGGLIHGLRLNFLEWYRYSFQGGGKPFIPLQKMEVE